MMLKGRDWRTIIIYISNYLAFVAIMDGVGMVSFYSFGGRSTQLSLLFFWRIAFRDFPSRNIIENLFHYYDCLAFTHLDRRSAEKIEKWDSWDVAAESNSHPSFYQATVTQPGLPMTYAFGIRPAGEPAQYVKVRLWCYQMRCWWLDTSHTWRHRLEPCDFGSTTDLYFWIPSSLVCVWHGGTELRSCYIVPLRMG